MSTRFISFLEGLEASGGPSESVLEWLIICLRVIGSRNLCGLPVCVLMAACMVEIYVA